MIPRTLKEHTCSPARLQAVGFARDQLFMFTMKLNKYNTTEKFNTAEKYNCGLRRNTLQQPARRKAGAVICSSNCHLICMLRQKILHMGIEGVQGKPLKQRGGQWKVRWIRRLPLQHFSHFTDFTLFRVKMTPLPVRCFCLFLSLSLPLTFRTHFFLLYFLAKVFKKQSLFFLSF